MNSAPELSDWASRQEKSDDCFIVFPSRILVYCASTVTLTIRTNEKEKVVVNLDYGAGQTSLRSSQVERNLSFRRAVSHWLLLGPGT